MHEDALKLGRAVGYNNAGTVEFLVDADTGAFYFIEVNPRIQVEHTVTEVVTGVDLVKPRSGSPTAPDRYPGKRRSAAGRDPGQRPRPAMPGHDGGPGKQLHPRLRVLTAYRGATGFGVRLDGGHCLFGARITPFYDSLLEKVTTWAPTPDEAIQRMDRALREFRIRGVATNLAFLENVIGHPQFLDGSYTTRFVDRTAELFSFAERRDRATRLLRYIGEVVVNGNDAVEGRAEPPTRQAPGVPEAGIADIPDGSRQRLDSPGTGGLRPVDAGAGPGADDRHHVRDAHQSLLRRACARTTSRR